MRISASGKVADNRLKIYDEIGFREQVKKLNGKPVNVIVDDASRRSNQQLRYYWGVVVRMISDYTGQDSDDIHEFLKDKFNAVEFDIPNKDTGESEHAKIGRTTTKMTTLQFKEYIEKIQVWAAEFLGVVIPDPDQKEWIEEL